jgi:hypothetical protein
MAFTSAICYAFSMADDAPEEGLIPAFQVTESTQSLPISDWKRVMKGPGPGLRGDDLITAEYLRGDWLLDQL